MAVVEPEKSPTYTPQVSVLPAGLKLELAPPKVHTSGVPHAVAGTTRDEVGPVGGITLSVPEYVSPVGQYVESMATLVVPVSEVPGDELGFGFQPRLGVSGSAVAAARGSIASAPIESSASIVTVCLDIIVSLAVALLQQVISLEKPKSMHMNLKFMGDYQGKSWRKA